MASQGTVTAPSKRKAVTTGASRPRKKQAVTKTFKRSTIQKIERNALTSPLLSLPGEIREKILKLVVGDKVIHINVCKFGVRGRSALKYHQGSLCHSICTGSGNACGCFGSDQVRMYGHCLCRSIPYDLNDLSPGPKFHQWNTIKISLLATSRQLYEEYNLLIWHTDVFSFDDPSAFTIFLESLNNQQRKNIRNLQIRPIASKCALPGQHGILCNEYPIVHVHQWNLEDSRDPLVHRLRGVKSLHIRMKYIGSRDRIQPSRLQLELALSNLQVLRLMPLERAIVSFSIEPFNKSRTTLDPEIKRLAAMFRRKLLDPSGLEKVKNAIWFMKGLRFHSQVSMNIFNPEYMNLSKGPRVLY